MNYHLLSKLPCNWLHGISSIGKTEKIMTLQKSVETDSRRSHHSWTSSYCSYSGEISPTSSPQITVRIEKTITQSAYYWYASYSGYFYAWNRPTIVSFRHMCLLLPVFLFFSHCLSGSTASPHQPNNVTLSINLFAQKGEANCTLKEVNRRTVHTVQWEQRGPCRTGC